MISVPVPPDRRVIISLLGVLLVITALAPAVAVGHPGDHESDEPAEYDEPICEDTFQQEHPDNQGFAITDDPLDRDHTTGPSHDSCDQPLIELL